MLAVVRSRITDESTKAGVWPKAPHKVDLLHRLLGHKSPAMLWEHYYKAVTKKRAAHFWEIEPPKRGGKIVSVAA